MVIPYLWVVLLLRSRLGYCCVGLMTVSRWSLSIIITVRNNNNIVVRGTDVDPNFGRVCVKERHNRFWVVCKSIDFIYLQLFDKSKGIQKIITESPPQIFWLTVVNLLSDVNLPHAGSSSERHTDASQASIYDSTVRKDTMYAVRGTHPTQSPPPPETFIYFFSYP